MAGAEQLLQELLRVAQVPGGDPLLQGPHLAGDGLHERLLALGQGRDDRIRQLERRPGTEPAGLDAPQHRAGLTQRGLFGDRRVDRAVDGDHIAGADELVELDVVDVAAGAELGGVQDHENVVTVGPDLGHGVALDAGLDGERVEAEDLPQHLDGLLVADRDVHPHQPVVAGEQLLQLSDRMLLDSFIGHEMNVHPAGHLLEAVIPAPSLPPPRPRRLNSQAKYREDCVCPHRGGQRTRVATAWLRTACASVILLPPGMPGRTLFPALGTGERWTPSNAYRAATCWRLSPTTRSAPTSKSNCSCSYPGDLETERRLTSLGSDRGPGYV